MQPVVATSVWGEGRRLLGGTADRSTCFSFGETLVLLCLGQCLVSTLTTLELCLAHGKCSTRFSLEKKHRKV